MNIVTMAGIVFSAVCVLCIGGVIESEEIDVRAACFLIAVLSGIMAYNLFTF